MPGKLRNRYCRNRHEDAKPDAAAPRANEAKRENANGGYVESALRNHQSLSHRYQSGDGSERRYRRQGCYAQRA
ncbi:hypothetical protein CBM2629_A60036 [Cupriavidus taiwanensis]|nr:hypothetical protein CBM2629_A60036 [Cupriavidus taiwanensis]